MNLLIFITSMSIAFLVMVAIGYVFHRIEKKDKIKSGYIIRINENTYFFVEFYGVHTISYANNILKIKSKYMDNGFNIDIIAGYDFQQHYDNLIKEWKRYKESN